MSQKEETRFRQGQVLPFLKTLKNTFFEPIQQVAVHGSADYHLCINGRFVSLELKRVGGKSTGMQAYKLFCVRVAGGVSIVASPTNWKEVKQVLSKMSQSKEEAWNQRSLL